MVDFGQKWSTLIDFCQKCANWVDFGRKLSEVGGNLFKSWLEIVDFDRFLSKMVDFKQY
jgi:hypothetical protein